MTVRYFDANFRNDTQAILAVADLHVTLFDQAVLEGKNITGGSAYYFSANGDVATADWAPLVAKALHKYGALKTAEITPFSAEELQKVSRSYSSSQPL